MSTTSGAIPQETNNANNQEEVDINLEDPQVQDAAKKIQNVFRVKRFADKKAAAVSNSAAPEKQ